MVEALKDDHLAGIDPVLQAVVVSPNAVYIMQDSNPEQKRKHIPIGDKRWYPWGDDDRMPNRFFESVYSNDLLPINMDRTASLLSGIGVYLYQNVKDGRNIVREELLQEDYPEIDDFFLENEVDTYVHDRAMNLRIFYNAFTSFYQGRLTFSDKIVKIKNESVQDCRCGYYETYESPNGHSMQLIKDYYMSGDFKGATMIGGSKDQGISDVLPIPSGELHKDDLKGKAHFMRHTKIYQSGQDYYSFPAWYFGLKNWLKIAERIASYQLSNLDNSAAPKYLVIIPERVINARASVKNEKDLLKVHKEIADDIEKKLSSPKNAGKTITTVSYRVGDGQLEHIQILAIPNNNNDTLFLPSFETTTRVVSRSSGLSPILSGIHLDGSQGSGSEIKYLYNYEVQVAEPMRQKLLSDLRFVFRHNGWDRKIKVDIRNAKMIDTSEDKSGISNPQNPQKNAVQKSK
jgi:hypothetical protein